VRTGLPLDLPHHVSRPEGEDAAASRSEQPSARQVRAVRRALEAPGAGWGDELVEAVRVVHVTPATPLLEHGDGDLVVVLGGIVEVRVDGRLVAHPGPGCVLGALTGRTAMPAGTAVAAVTNGVVARIPADAVRRVVRRDTELALHLHGLVAAASGWPGEPLAH
jgi:hypothetical protein